MATSGGISATCMTLLKEMTAYGRFGLGLPSFLRHRITLDDARQTIRTRMANREASFLRLVERGVFGYSESPYLKLMKRAGCEFVDVENLLATKGLEATLDDLYHAGVHVTFEEFKGRTPIIRGSDVIPTDHHSFDNPHLKRYYHAETGGTTGRGLQVGTDLDHLRGQSAHVMVTNAAHGVLHVPSALWRGVLPDGSGLHFLLCTAHFGDYFERWFSPLPPHDPSLPIKYRLATQTTIGIGRLAGIPLPWPEHVGLEEAIIVARWCAETVRTRGSCLVSCVVSRALQVSLAASEAGLRLDGVTFMVGGEPPTLAKTRVIESTGARHFPTYGQVDAGRIGAGCSHPVNSNDLHLLRDAFAVIQKPRLVPGSDIEVNAFNMTSLLWTTPKLMLNVELDDYGIIEQRSCGCPLEELGFTDHIRELRSFQKLTGEGVTLVGSEMVHVLEDVLPARFGGSSLDYQLLEEEDNDGFTRLYLLIHPDVDLADEAAPVRTVVESLRKSSVGSDVACDIWTQAGTLRVRRARPVWTSRGKLMPLHLANGSKRNEPEQGHRTNPKLAERPRDLP